MSFFDSLLCHASNMHCKIHDIKYAIQDAAWSAEDRAYKSIDCVIENPVKSAAIATTTIVSASVAYVHAPVIAVAIAKTGVLGKTATTGAVISKLTGAPLVTASLAKIGGGAISIGGTGMAGGTAVIAGTGAATGGAVAVGVVSKVK
ncbi:hypothetical protein [Acinetobacter sp. ANC 4177]|uniref:hypothetical protein n=1 Tax=Acinetobacter sp. ANC 4177 TaxID=2529838 RepID=UPI00103F372D|nr:hypothetical protein [Acinetobacter sp. ANC 4177]TCB72576.1 hypothetical protein E0H91_15290 [Acinetobacter sp. ANC 4177]